MTLQFDTPADGQTLKMLNVNEEFSEAPARNVNRTIERMASSMSFIGWPWCTGRRTSCASTTGRSSLRTR